MAIHTDRLVPCSVYPSAGLISLSFTLAVRLLKQLADPDLDLIKDSDKLTSSVLCFTQLCPAGLSLTGRCEPGLVVMVSCRASSSVLGFVVVLNCLQEIFPSSTTLSTTISAKV